MIPFSKVLVTVGSLLSIAFGIWHFTVPRAWNWYAYIEPRATELVVAVRAINLFFSLSLVLFGVLNLLFAHGHQANRYSILVLLAVTSILWLTRVLMQVIHPQGTLFPGLQYGMLAAFTIIALCYIVSLILTLLEKNPI